MTNLYISYYCIRKRKNSNALYIHLTELKTERERDDEDDGEGVKPGIQCYIMLFIKVKRVADYTAVCLPASQCVGFV